jgi:methionyl-tRNA formyltransferase
MIRAVAEPYPGAFVGDGPARVHLWAASIHEDSASAAAPGTVVEIVPARGIACGDGPGHAPDHTRAKRRRRRRAGRPLGGAPGCAPGDVVSDA